MSECWTGRSLRDRRLDPLWIQAPHVARSQIGEPDGPQPYSNGIAALAFELLNDFVGGGIDPRNGELEGSDPHRSFTVSDFTASARYTNLNSRDDFVCFHVDFGNVACC